MKTLTINLENCYGIRKLEATLDFSGTRAIAIYAPNGAMKSSLAQTFKDIADGNQSLDRIFPTRKTQRLITDQDGKELPKENVAVIKTYEAVLGHDERTSTLLINSELRLRFENLLKDFEKKRETLIKALKKVSGTSKKDIEREISSTFLKSDNNEFLKALRRMREEIGRQADAPFKDIKYDVVFDERTIKLLGTKNFKDAIAAYLNCYNSLLDKSTYFKRGVFNYYNASTIARNLAENGFFNAKHSLRLNGENAVEIQSFEELQNLIQAERDSITEDTTLKKTFSEIEEAMNKHQDLRGLHAYLLENESMLPHLANIGTFKEEVWKSYLKVCYADYVDLLVKEDEIEEEKKKIEATAGQERTQWEEVIDIFNDRFSVPFVLSAANKIQVMLGQEKLLTLGFTFKDGNDKAEIERDKLLDALSTGEKKAFYVLNVMFDMEVRKKTNKPALFIVDDIADSFDYKNKYAIIEYLRDIAHHESFRQIILTHNFDFFRTACSRYVKRENCFMAVKTADGISLTEAYGVNNVFQHWKANFYQNPIMKIASIPFIRNIVEYTKGQDDPSYLLLTSMLHIKSGSEAITVRQLDKAFQNCFNMPGASVDADMKLIDYVQERAKECLVAAEGANFENKIVLAIAIRLLAERYMILKIANPTAVDAILSNQTNKLFDIFKSSNPNEPNTEKVLRQVLLMTPEAIHLNSFMYEPIVDMSDEHLKRLYVSVSNLN